MDRALFISLLLCGGKARLWSWGEALDRALEMPMAVYHELRMLAEAEKLVLEPIKPDRFGKAYWIMGARMEAPIFTARGHGQPFTTQEVTRRMKRFARLAGLQASVNLRMVVNTHHWLAACYRSMDEAAEALGVAGPPSAPTLGRVQARTGGQEDLKRHLHGIGRRPQRRLSSVLG